MIPRFEILDRPHPGPDQPAAARRDLRRDRRGPPARPGNISRNTWITEAIEEKLARERAANATEKAARTACLASTSSSPAAAWRAPGLGAGWTCLFANDFDPKKGLTYRPTSRRATTCESATCARSRPRTCPATPTSSGARSPARTSRWPAAAPGLKGERSGTFYPFWDVMKALIADGPRAQAHRAGERLGTLTSHGGRDFEAICKTFADAGYRYGALVINAELFVPQSRPRLFVIGVREDVEIDPALLSPGPIAPFHTRGPAAGRRPRRQGGAEAACSGGTCPPRPRRNTTFADLIEENPTSVRLAHDAERDQLLAMMSPVNRAKVEAAKKAGRRMVGGRLQAHPPGRERGEGAARRGPLRRRRRLPAHARRRLEPPGDHGRRRPERPLPLDLRARDRAADGPGRDYKLPKNYNEAYHLTGDGVAVHVVRHLAEHIFEPLTRPSDAAKAAA